MLPSTGMKSSISASRSQPSGNTKNNKISQTTSSNIKNKVEDHPRSVKSSSNKKNRVSEPVCNANIEHTLLNANSELIYVKCNQCMFDENHDLCFLEFVNDVNVSSKSKSAKSSKMTQTWKPTSKVFTNIGYRWKPTGRNFTIVGNSCPLIRLSKLFSGNVRFGNDQIMKIMGYGDYQMGNVTISQVYYVEGLGHNLFSIGQFCDSDLEAESVATIFLYMGDLPARELHSWTRDLTYLHVFGALCYPTNNSEDLDKLKPQADIRIFIGYAPAKKAYRIYNKWTRLIIEAIHIDFDEITAVASEQYSSGPGPQLLTLGIINSGLMPNPPSPTSYVPPTKKDWDILFQSMFDAADSIVYLPQLQLIKMHHLQVLHKTLNKTHSLVIPSGVEEQFHDIEELVPRPDRVMIITLKWIFKVKLDELGGVLKNKARSLRQSTRRFIDQDNPNHVYKLKKALYRLKQAPRAWYDLSSSFLLSQNFSKGTVDPTLFTRKEGKDILLVQIYVDGIIFASTDRALCYCGNDWPPLCNLTIQVQGQTLYCCLHRALYQPFTDADHAGFQDTRRSTSGSMQLLGDRLKRRHDNKDQDPAAGSDQWLKKRKSSKDVELYKKPTSTGFSIDTTQSQPKPTGDDLGNTNKQPNVKAAPKHDWFKKLTRPPTPDPEWNTRKSVDKGPTQNWLNDLTNVEKPPLSFDDLMSTPIDFFAFAINHLKINKLTKADLVGPNNPKGNRYPYDLSKPLPLHESRGRLTVPTYFFFNNDLEYLRGGSNDRKYTASTTNTKARKYEIEGIEDMVTNLWSLIKVAYEKYTALGISYWDHNVKGSMDKKRIHPPPSTVSTKVSRHDVYSTMRILSVTSVTVDKWYGYGHLKEIVVGRADQKLYKFIEGDFPRLHLNDIEDMLLLVFQNMLNNLKGDVIVDLAVALRMYTRRIVIQKRVKDLQLGVESYQKKLNISKPITRDVDLSHRVPYTTLSEPQGVI
ncbi:retrovirus-related pol polyprotein from transposon TNT 1-94 [Tanacetum coccineum]